MADANRPALPPTAPGQRVRHPGRPDWGVGQVQSIVGHRITVNFEHAGKILVNASVIALEVIAESAPGEEGP